MDFFCYSGIMNLVRSLAGIYTNYTFNFCLQWIFPGGCKFLEKGADFRSFSELTGC